MTDPLFSKNPDKIVIAYDFKENKHYRNLKNFRFRVSVYGILLDKENILMQRNPVCNKFGLPGGGVNIDETVPEALIREFSEETGLSIKVGRLLQVADDYFTLNGEDAHGILIFYEVFKVGGKLLVNGNNVDTVEVKFINISQLNEGNTQRIFLQEIGNMTKSIRI